MPLPCCWQFAHYGFINGQGASFTASDKTCAADPAASHVVNCATSVPFGEEQCASRGCCWNADAASTKMKPQPVSSKADLGAGMNVTCSAQEGMDMTMGTCCSYIYM